MNGTPKGSIVVGVDGSPDSDRAVAWAAVEARLSDRAVHLVHSLPLLPGDSPVTDLATYRDKAAATLAAAEHLAHTHGAVASSRVVEGYGLSPARAMLDASAGASMVVLGARGHGGFAGLLMGSVSQHVARHAECPVVAVRVAQDPKAERIVVAVDGSEGAQHALGFAFDLASRRGAPVTAVHAWHATALVGVGAAALPVPVDVAAQQQDQQRQLSDEVNGWRQKYPDVVVTTEVIPGHPAQVLGYASEHASLVVVGSRGRGAFAGLLLGSVSQAVMHHAMCPVAVVR